jgi:hypothetical protein
MRLRDNITRLGGKVRQGHVLISSSFCAHHLESVQDTCIFGRWLVALCCPAGGSNEAGRPVGMVGWPGAHSLGGGATHNTVTSCREAVYWPVEACTASGCMHAALQQPEIIYVDWLEGMAGVLREVSSSCLVPSVFQRLHAAILELFPSALKLDWSGVGFASLLLALSSTRDDVLPSCPPVPGVTLHPCPSPVTGVARCGGKAGHLARYRPLQAAPS